MAQELVFKLSVTGEAAAKAAVAGLRAEIAQAGQTQKTVATGELSMRQQLAAAASLQRQRSAALISEWKKTENAAKQLATGVQPVGFNLQRITDIMQTLGGSSATLQGPLGGVAGRLRSVGALATEAGGGLGIAGVAAGGLTVIAVGLAVALFKVTVAAAEFQGKFHDLSQQTGVNVETLSTLDAVARTTGGDIDAIAQSLGLFQSKLEDAQDPTSKEAKLLKELGVESTNTEEALQQALAALSRMPEGYQQTAAARDLFGGRGAKAFLAILKETNGDLDATTERLRAMGALVTGPMAAAADKFNDRLVEVGLQIQGLTAIVGNEAMPAISSAVKTVSDLITDNREVIVGWTHSLGDAARGAYALAGMLNYLSSQVTGLSNIPVPLILRFLGAIDPSGISNILKGIASLGTPTDIPALAVGNAALTPVPLRPSNAPSGTKTRAGRGGGGSKQDEIYKAALEASKQAAAEEIETQRTLSVSLKQAYELNLVTLQDYYSNRQGLINLNFNIEIDAINREQAALEAARTRGLIKKQEALKAEADLTARTTKAQNQLNEDTRELSIERQRALDKADLDLNKQLADIKEAGREGELKRIEAALDRQAITESEAISRRLALYKEEHAERMLLLDLELKQITTSASRKIAIDNEKIASEQRFTDEIKRLTQERIEAYDRERLKTAPGSDVKPGTEDDFENQMRIAMAGVNAELGPPPEASQAWLILKETAMDALSNMAQGVGHLLQQWIIYGSVGPNAVKKMLAAVLAAAAGQAAVEAIMQLAHAAKEYALGVAAASNPFTAAMAPGHFAAASAHITAAGIYGAVAGVAAVSGRVIAGNAFNESTGGRAAGGSSGGGRSTSTTPVPREVDRRGSSQIGNITIVVSGEAGEAFNYKVVKAVIGNHRLNGEIRALTERGES